MTAHADGFANVHGYVVDVQNLGSIAHGCDPALCRESGSCCACYDVWIGDEERSRLLELLPGAARYAAHLRDGAGFREVLKPLGPDAYAVEKREDGLCVFAYAGAGDEVLCALHSAALDVGLAPERAKPDSCVLWPLTVTSSRPPVISVHEDAFRFPCNRRREPGRLPLDQGIVDVIRAAFGDGFLSALAAEAPGVLPPV